MASRISDGRPANGAMGAVRDLWRACCRARVSA